MKKILTFLVMLVACVSILSAQDTQIPQAKFNYQAVVRDRTNHDNLVMGETVNVQIAISQINSTSADFSPVYTEYREVTTNRNGMVSFVIGLEDDGVEEIEGDLSTIDWTNAVIRAIFTNANGDILSEVENVVMPVPLALQAAEDPIEITTQKIVEYIQGADGDAVNAIYQAIVTNENGIKNDITDSIISYIKTQPAKVKELAIYFLTTVTVNDARDAYNALSADVKQAIKDAIVDTIKHNKDLAYEILADYLTNTTKEEVQQLWSAARANDDFHVIFDAVRDSAVTYVMNHPQYVKQVAEYYVGHVLTINDVRAIYDTLRDKNPQLHADLINKFNEYLNSYIGNSYVKACGDVTICDLKNELDAAKAEASNCAYFVEWPTATKGADGFYRFNAEVGGVVPGSTNNPSITITKPNDPTYTYFPGGNYQWQVSVDGNHYFGETNAFSDLNIGDKVLFILGDGNCKYTREVTVTAE